MAIELSKMSICNLLVGKNNIIQMCIMFYTFFTLLFNKIFRTNLKILGLMTMDSGMFQCLASNPAGNIQSSAFLNVFHAGNLIICFK